MAVFEYRGILAVSGKAVHGVRDADNARTLRATLKREGVLLTNANETQGARSRSVISEDALALFRRVNLDDVSMMTRQLATLVAAGIPLVESVGALIEQVEKLVFAPVYV